MYDVWLRTGPKRFCLYQTLESDLSTSTVISELLILTSQIGHAHAQVEVWMIFYRVDPWQFKYGNQWNRIKVSCPKKNNCKWLLLTVESSAQQWPSYFLNQSVRVTSLVTNSKCGRFNIDQVFQYNSLSARGSIDCKSPFAPVPDFPLESYCRRKEHFTQTR